MGCWIHLGLICVAAASQLAIIQWEVRVGEFQLCWRVFSCYWLSQIVLEKAIKGCCCCLVLIRGWPNLGFGYSTETASKMTQTGFGFGQHGFSQVGATAISGTGFRQASIGRQHCPGRHWSVSSFVIWPLSCRPSASGYALNMLQHAHISLLSKTNHVVAALLPHPP